MFGGILNSELLIFGYILVLNFDFFLLRILRRALIAPDEATAGGSSPRLRANRACPGLTPPLNRDGV